MAGAHRDVNTLRILLIDDEAPTRSWLARCLEAEGHAVAAWGHADVAGRASLIPLDVIFLGVRPAADHAAEPLPRLLAENPWAQVIVVGACASAAQARYPAAADYLPAPFTAAQVGWVTRRAGERRSLAWKVHSLQGAPGRHDPGADFPTASPAMKAALDLARQVAGSSASVLICGEAGTGKGRLARTIHGWSKRSDGPLTAASCDAPADALDVELFGATPAAAGVSAVGVSAAGVSAVGEPAVGGPAVGMYDGARGAGKVAASEGGTLVLHEVGDTPASLQPKLHRLLADNEYERHNDFTPRRANVRVVATTRDDLAEAVRLRRFRPELLLALDVVKIDLPPLRQHPQDVRLLAKWYLKSYARPSRRPHISFTAEVLRVLDKYPWPGNARELRNLVERAVLLCPGDHVGLEHFPPNLLNTAGGFKVGDMVPLETIEDAHIRRVLESAGSVARAAAILGVGKSTVFRWLKRSPGAAGRA